MLFTFRSQICIREQVRTSRGAVWTNAKLRCTRQANLTHDATKKMAKRDSLHLWLALYALLPFWSRDIRLIAVDQSWRASSFRGKICHFFRLWSLGRLAHAQTATLWWNLSSLAKHTWSFRLRPCGAGKLCQCRAKRQTGWARADFGPAVALQHHLLKVLGLPLQQSNSWTLGSDLILFEWIRHRWAQLCHIWFKSRQRYWFLWGFAQHWSFHFLPSRSDTFRLATKWMLANPAHTLWSVPVSILTNILCRTFASPGLSSEFVVHFWGLSQCEKTLSHFFHLSHNILQSISTRLRLLPGRCVSRILRL